MFCSDPRSLSLDTILSSVPETWYRVVLLSLLGVIRMTSHLLRLHLTRQQSVPRSRVVRSGCKEIKSSTFIICRYIDFQYR